VADPTLYLFDGYNLLHAGEFEDERELTDVLAGFVAVHGARGVVVFDGVGADKEVGPLSIRFAPHADALLERLAAEHRGRELVCLVSSDGRRAWDVRPGGAQAELADVPRRPGAGAAPGGRCLPRARPARPRDARQAGTAPPRRRLTAREHAFPSNGVLCKWVVPCASALLCSPST
jgi:hypothetical protein